MTDACVDPSRLTRGYALAISSAAILSTTAILIRHLTQAYALPALVLAFWRDGFAALTVLPVLAWLRPSALRVSRANLSFLATYGLVLAAFNALWTHSVALNGAAISTVLVYCSVGFTTLLGRWLLHERLDAIKLLVVAVSLGGCGLVSGALDRAAWQANALGILTGTTSGLCYAVYSVMGRAASGRRLNPWTTLLYTFGFAALYLLLFNLMPGRLFPGKAARPADLLWLRDSLAGWTVLFLLAAGPTVLGFGLYNISLGNLPSSVANLILTLEPVFTAGIAALVLGERFTSVQVGGSLMILAGVVILRVHQTYLVSKNALPARCERRGRSAPRRRAL
jgi:drug/metabolite transporter (DMT)-like permease